MPGRREEPARGILRVDTDLDGVPRPGRPSCRRQLLAGGDPDLLADDVDPGDELGHRMLDLEPAVDLDEVEGAVRSDEELERSRVPVADRLACLRDRRLHRLARRVVERGGRGLLDELLVAALDRALTLAEGQHPSGGVAQHLDLDVACGRDELLDVDRAVAERRLRLGARRAVRVLEVVRARNEPHSLPAATRGRLEQHGKARVGGRPAKVGEADCAVGAGHERDSGRPHRLFRAHLVPHLLDDRSGRADEDDVVVVARTHELGVLGEEPVAGVHRVAPRRLGRGHDVRDPQVALRRRGRPDAHRLVGELDVERVAVGGRVDRDRLDPQLVQRTDDAHGDLAPVRDENAFEHGDLDGGRREDGLELEQELAVLDRLGVLGVDRTHDARVSALSSLNSFIASRTQSTWPGTTVSPTSTNAGAPGCGAR